MPRLTHRPHQVQAVEAIVHELASADRATAVMACGTGKTAVGVWAAGRLVDPDGTILLLFPKLSLIQQSLPTWAANHGWGFGYRAMAVCSDTSVADGPESDVDVRPEDLGAPVSTDPASVAAFLRGRGGPRVLFATYQSAGVVGEAARAAGIHFDLGVFDEAHRTAGRRGGQFSVALEDDGVPIRKRVFMTATPKRTRRAKRDRDGNLAVYSMDDEKAYGRVAYRLSFRRAAAEKIICDYRVLVSVVTAAELGARPGDAVVEVDGSLVPIEVAAGRVALARAVERTGARKVFTFHSTRASSRDFAEGEGQVGVASHLPGFDIGYVDGTQSAGERAESIRRFGAAGKALRSSVGCLIEGVDVPDGDLAAFMDRKESRVDIAQAVGRVLRRPLGSGKETAHVLVPLLVQADAGETVSEAVARSSMDTLWDVLASLMDQDELMHDAVARLCRSGPGSAEGAGEFRSRVEVMGSDTVDLAAVRRAVEVACIQEIGRPFDFKLGMLARFAGREGHSCPPIRHEEDGFPLGAWVTRFRKANGAGQMPPDQVAACEALPGWSWDPQVDRWFEKYNALKELTLRTGTARLAIDHMEGDLPLGRWAVTQRSWRGSGRLPEWKVCLLERLPGWTWSLREDKFASDLVRLRECAVIGGTTRLPAAHPLRALVNSYRTSYATGYLTPEKIAALEALPGWIWNTHEAAFRDKVDALAAFSSREGHINVPTVHVESGENLSRWLARLRRIRHELLDWQVAALETQVPYWTWEDPYGPYWRQAATEVIAELEVQHDRKWNLSPNSMSLAFASLPEEERRALRSMVSARAEELRAKSKAEGNDEPPVPSHRHDECRSPNM